MGSPGSIAIGARGISPGDVLCLTYEAMIDENFSALAILRFRLEVCFESDAVLRIPRRYIRLGTQI